MGFGGEPEDLLGIDMWSDNAEWSANLVDDLFPLRSFLSFELEVPRRKLRLVFLGGQILFGLLGLLLLFRPLLFCVLAEL